MCFEGVGVDVPNSSITPLLSPPPRLPAHTFQILDLSHELFDLGVNFFDTSPYYGGTLSEKILGKCFQALNVLRSEYIVSTKCGRYADGFDFSAERVTKSIDESLERLLLQSLPRKELIKKHCLKLKAF